MNAATAEANVQSSPWRFLKPLGDESDDRALVELTRADELRIVTDMISASRVSLLYAPSGNGKSSLLNAGVIPFFKAKGYCVFRTRPRPPHSPLDPLLAFKESILTEPPPLFGASDVVKLRQLRRQLAERPDGLEQEAGEFLQRVEDKMSQLQQVPAPRTSEVVTLLRQQIKAPLVEFVGRIAEIVGEETRILLVCDQFEELFVHYNNAPQLEEFVRQLGDLWAESALRVGLLFSMREDWVGSLIAFRKAVPDIFVNYYKLYPLAAGCAEKVLKEPLEQRGMKWGAGVAERVIQDLAGSYQLNQANRFNGIDLLPSPQTDPYVELPALQVVAEKLWQTRSGQHEPFSMGHYESLAPVPESSPRSPESEARAPDCLPAGGSPADWCLDHYLTDQLAQLDEGAVLKDLRLDCLYLLTDRIKHRRALPEPLLLEELNHLRRGGPGMEKVDRALLERAMRPLITCRLVSKTEAGDRGTQFELAHDFAVRSVVREWRSLAQARAIEEALLLRQMKETEAHTVELVRREVGALGFLLIGPAATILALSIWTAYFCFSFSLFSQVKDLSIFACLCGALFVGTLVVGVTTRTILSSAVGVLGLLEAVYLTTVRYAVYETMIALIVSCVALAILYVFSVVDLSARLGFSVFKRRFLRVMLGELVDLLVAIGPIFLGVLSSILRMWQEYLWWIPATAFAGFLLNAILAIRDGRTLGLRAVGLRIQTRDGKAASVGRILLRQSLLLIWSFLNLFLLVPWIIGTLPIVWRSAKKQNFYDSWAGLMLIEAEAAQPGRAVRAIRAHG